MVKPAEFALIKGVARQTVFTAMKARIADAIVMRGDVKWLDKDLALQLWDRNTLRNNNAKVSPPAVPAEAAPTTKQLRDYIQQLPEDAIPDLNESRARREHYQAEKARLEALQGRGELVTTDTVKAEASRLARQVRDLLLMIPARCAAQAAALTDPGEVRGLLEREIEQALRGLADA